MLEKFFDGYIECALWSSVDGDGDPMEDNYDRNAIDPDTFKKMYEECENFYKENLEVLMSFCNELNKNIETAWEYAGHDFWLTRNGHGAGYFDRGVSDEVSEVLTKASKAAGTSDLYIGDDGYVYVM
jgi:hypothetical protein